MGSQATGQFRHASTMDLPDDDSDDHVARLDLNISPTIIDLTGPQLPLPRIHRKKCKRIVSPTSNSPRSSNQASKGEEIMEDLTRNFYEIRDQLESTMIKSSTSNSGANVCPNTGRPRDWLIKAMNIINTLAEDMAMPTRAHRKVCGALKVKDEAKVFVHMNDACRRDWLLAFLSPNFD
jgi:hypothetical protein